VSSIGLGEDEIELYERLVEADERHYSDVFTVNSLGFPAGASLLFHRGLISWNLKWWTRSLVVLNAAGMIISRAERDGIPTEFYLPSDARHRLEEAEEEVQQLYGLRTPLVEAKERIALLEERAATTDARHHAIAERFGRRVQLGMFIVLMLVVAGLAIWALLLSTILPAILAVAVIVYAVLTDAWGWTAQAVAERAGEWIRRWVLGYLDPGS
jgi:hypothetical protein